MYGCIRAGEECKSAILKSPKEEVMMALKALGWFWYNDSSLEKGSEEWKAHVWVLVASFVSLLPCSELLKRGALPVSPFLFFIISYTEIACS